MYRYKITIEYVGTNLCGWQRQDNGISVQEIIENAIYQFSKCKVTLFGAGRTDSGVHALGQIAHFDLDKQYDLHVVIKAINHFVRPYKIIVISCNQISRDFHARFSATARHYMYKIVNRPIKSVLEEDRAWWISQTLDLDLMQMGADYLIGTHNFNSFRAKYCQASSPIKTLSQIYLIKNGDKIKIFISAPSFLHHMVRNIVGTLKLVGIGKLNPEDIKRILEEEDRTKAGPTAPAYGLYFLGADYKV